MGHELRIGEKLSTQINIHDVTQLDKEIEHPQQNSTRRSCSTDPYDSCMYTQLANKMVAETEDNCTVPWFPHKNPICKKEKDMNHTYYIAYNRLTNVMRDCNEPCHSLVANIGGKNTQKNETWDYGMVLFYFSATSFKSEENYLYPMRSLIAEFGGYLGLLLGVSCLDLALKLIDSCVTRMRKKKIFDASEDSSTK